MPFKPYQLSDKEKGQGLKATRDIDEGELLFKAMNNIILFTNGDTYREFLFGIYERNGELYDSETGCNVLIWSWVQALEGDGGSRLVIVTDLDNTLLLNEAQDKEPNVRCGGEGGENCRDIYYATRDIKKGDELLGDYTHLALMAGWPKVGL